MAERGRPRLHSDARILEIALRAFGRQGFDGVSLRELNRALGTSPAMLAKRFGTKEALWRAAVDHGFGQHRDALAAAVAAGPPPADARAALEGLVAAFVRTAARFPHLQQVVNVEGATDSWRLDHLFEHVVEPILAGVARPWLDPLVAAGALRPVTDREVFFLVANGAASVCALAPLAQRFDRRDGPLDVDVYAASVARLLVGALRP